MQISSGKSMLYKHLLYDKRLARNATSSISVFSLFQFQNNFWQKFYEKKLLFLNFFQILSTSQNFTFWQVLEIKWLPNELNGLNCFFIVWLNSKRLSWMKLCSSYNHCTKAPPKMPFEKFWNFAKYIFLKYARVAAAL